MSATMTNKSFWVAVRQALLMIVDAIERDILEYEDCKRTSVIRKGGANG